MTENSTNNFNVEALLEPLPGHLMPNTNYTYAKSKDVIKKLNKAFNFLWSSRVISWETKDDHIVCIMELAVSINGHEVKKIGAGGQTITRSRSGDKRIIDLGNDYHTAFTAALKSAVKQLGITIEKPDQRGGAPYIPPSNTRPAPTQRPAARPTPSPKKPSAPVENNPKPSEPIKPQTPSRPQRPGQKATAKPTKPVVPKEIQKQVNKILNEQLPPERPKKSVGAVLNNMHQETKEHNPFLAPASATENISHIQKSAINNLTKKLGISEEELLKQTLPESDKTKIEQLTKKEAPAVIRGAQKLLQDSSKTL